MQFRNTALALAIAASLGLGLTASSFAAAPQESASAQKTLPFLQTVRWDAEYDVIVLGYGFAGGAAAIAAADNGAHVLLSEKAPEGQEGGNSRYAAQHCININPEVSDADAMKYFKKLRGLSSNPSDAVYETFIKEARHNLEYLKFLGAKNPSVAYNAAEYPEYEGSKAIGRAIVKKPGGDGAIYALIQKNVRDRQAKGKIDVWFDAPGVHLIQDPQTKIIHGVQIKVDGLMKNVRARNGVILATGGYENNIDMFRNYAHTMHAYSKGAKFNTGDGILMAMDVKANIVNMADLNGPDPNVLNPATGISFGYMCAGAKDSDWSGPAFTSRDVIMVGQDGKRFWNEAQKTRHGRVPFHGDYWQLRMPSPAFMIFDEDARLASRVYGSWSDGAVDEIAQGLVKKADTIEALAKEIGVDPKGLAEQVKDYNQFCATGVDKQFNRPKKLLKPLDKGPFYAVEVVPTFTNTLGGPQHDETGAILDRDGNRIPHLYGAGELGSIFSDKYNGSGNIAESLVFGRIAGAQAAVVKTDVAQDSVLNGQPGFKPVVAQNSAKAEAGETIGRGRGMGGDVVIGVKMANGKITSVRVIESRETPGIGAKALETLPKEAVEKNGNVDTVSGATVTSNAFREALQDALAK